MKKSIKSLAFFLLISSIILPILPTFTVAQEDLIIYKVSGEALPGDWDPTDTDWYNIIWGSYGAIALQDPIVFPSYYTAGTEGGLMADEWIGILVTDWELEPWPIQTNVAGFNNTGGYKSVTLTLRENVTFTDGSAWNATVYKWNIDRSYLIHGNFTGKRIADAQHGGGTSIHDDDKDYFTEAWNMSKFDSPYIGTTPPGPGEDPKVTDYAYYDLGPNASLVEYPDVDILPNNTVVNPNPYGGWDYSAGAPIHHAPYDRYPHTSWVEILENPASGGKIKVHSGSWNTGGLPSYVNYPMLSYEAYRENFTINSVYGYQNGVKDEKNARIVTHMIGTGPYIFVEHDETGTPPGGYMIKNENYWNKTGLEAAGWFDVDKRVLIKFPAGSLGQDAKNTALLTHGIDYCWDSMYSPITEAAKANTNIAYYDLPVSEYKTNIVFNSVNETWWAWPAMDDWRQNFYDQAGDSHADGVPRQMRKAISYAFNYDIMIHTVLNDRAIRGGGVIGTPNLYYDPAVGAQKATYDKTVARNILLTTVTDDSVFNTSSPIVFYPNFNAYGHLPYDYHMAQGYFPNPDLYNFSKICTDRGLTASSTDEEWREVADNNPIFVLNFYWDSAHEDVKSVLQTSCEDIGVALADKTGATHRVSTIIWDTIRIGHLATFDGEHSYWSCGAWVMDEHLPHNYPQLNLFWAHVDPDKNRWRIDGTGGILSYHPWGNYGLNFDWDYVNNNCSPTDYYNDRMWNADPIERKHWINQIALRQQTVVYSKMWLYEAKEGWALWKDWEPKLVTNRWGDPAGPYGYGTPPTHFLRYVGLPEEYPLIPGAPLLITLTVSAVSIVGIAYTLMRKKRLS